MKIDIANIKKTMKQITITLVIGWSIIGILYFLNGVYDKQVRQKVTENNISDHWVERRLDTPSISETLAMEKNPYKTDGNIDSLIWKERQYWNRIRTIRDKRDNAPYKLITSYNHYEIIDYGSAREIDSLKCIRYHEMLNSKVRYDNLDEACKEAHKKQEEAQELIEAELDRLNKSCN